MKASQVINLMSQKLLPSDFRSSIRNEIEEYEKLIGKKGASSPISLTEDLHHNLTVSEILNLYRLFIDDELSQTELNYVENAILMSEKLVTEEWLYELIETAEEMKGEDKLQFTKKLVKKLENKIK